MPKIKTYDLIINPETTTKVVGTKGETSVGGPAFQTVNVSVGQIINLVGRSAIFTGTQSLLAYADDAAAAAAGLATGKLFQTSGAGAAPLNVAGIVMVKQ